MGQFWQISKTLLEGKTEWWRGQSAANQSPFKFPAMQGINREF
jgi:hypothetical protein